MEQYPNNEQSNLKKMNTALLIALSVAVLALLIVLAALLFSDRNKKTQSSAGPRIVAGDQMEEGELEQDETTAAPVTTVQSVESTEISNAPVVTAPASTAAPSPKGGVGYTGLYRVSYSTPAHAGVVVRQGPGSNTAKLGVLAEGTLVEYDSLVLPQNGYAKICWVENNNLYYGWVMTDYLIYHSDSTFSGNWGHKTPTEAPTSGKSTGDGMGHEGYPYVSYNTPAHAGVVVRGGPSSSTEKLGVIPEGTAVNPTGESANGYSKVVVDPYGQGYTGWIMTEYISYP